VGFGVGPHPFFLGIKARSGTGGLESLFAWLWDYSHLWPATRAGRTGNLVGVSDESCIHPLYDGERRTREQIEAGREGEGPAVDWLIADLAGRQHGVVGRGQLLELGLTRDEVDGRLAGARLHLVHRGVYAVGHTRVSRQGRWLAAVLACGPGAVLSHASAGALWGLTPPRSAAAEVSRPRAFRPRPGIRAHQVSLRVDERALRDGIPVTSLSRTLLDLAAVLDRDRLEKAINEAEVRRLTDVVSIPALLRRHPRRRGAGLLRSVSAGAERAGGVTKRELEGRFSKFVDAMALPRPRFNADLAVGGRFFEVDCLWEKEGLVVELDGHATHGTRRAFERDRERDRILLLEGWRVTRVTWRALHERPAGLASELRALLAIRG
jgi:very-short-patch-repair endonuclease